MKKFLASIVAVAMLWACQSQKGGHEEQKEDEAPVASTSSPGNNQLTEGQKSEGWKILFNGQNMEGWTIYQGKENDSWEVVDGTLHCKPGDVAKKRADLHTAEQYGDFELVFDFKIAPKKNSGLIYRSTEEFEHPYLSGPEYQIIDDKAWVTTLSPKQTTGSSYDMQAAPANKKMNPAGEWNTGKIVAKGNHIEHWLNGEKLLEYELQSPEWEKVKAGSKWKNAKGYGASAQGYIDLQDHGGEVWFRNIRVRTL